MGQMKYGRYGQYYEYEDEFGATVRISVKSKYITEQHMEQMITGKPVQFTRKSLFGVDIVEAKLAPFTITEGPRKGQLTTIIKTEVLESKDDRKTIAAAKDRIVADAFVSDMDYKRHVEAVLGTLQLYKDSWKVYVGHTQSSLPVDQQTDTNIYDALIIYRNYQGEDGLKNPEYHALEAFYKNDSKGTRLEEITKQQYYNAFAKFKQEREEVERQIQAAKQAVIQVRKDLYQAAQVDLEGLVSDIDFEQTLNLGHFQKLKTFLVRIKKQANAIYRICHEAYPEIEDAAELKVNLLYMLKVYYEFNNISEKNVKSIAKFVASHNIEDYYEDILKYDEALETIIDNSKDKKLLRRVLTDIAGNESKVNFLKDKSFYFEKTVRVKEKLVILFNPVQLLEELKNLIPVFNMNSQAAILTNIILNADESFTYQFYTYSQAEDGSDMDGRRVGYMAKLYNRRHENKLYFDYEDGSSDSEE